MLRSQSRDMWVFQEELLRMYDGGKKNAPYQSTVHRIERYRIKVSDPDQTLIMYRVLHTRNTRNN